MRNFLLRMLLVAALVVPWLTPGSSSVMAQNEVIIGTGTSSGYYVPMTNYYKNGRCEMIYTSEELGEVPSYIQSIAFQVNGSGSIPSQYTVYMGTSSSTTLTAWTPAADLTQVATFDNPLTVPSGWFTVELATPFYYDGTSSIVITVTHVGNAYNNSVTFYNSGSTSDHKAMYRESDSDPSYASLDNTTIAGTDAARPNTKFVMVPAGDDFCYAPAHVTATPNYSTMGVHATWENSHADAGTYYTAILYGPEGPIDSVVCEPFTTYADFSNLTANTEYTVQVRSHCSSENVSNLASSPAFSILAAPYSENFNNVNGIPTGWTILYQENPQYPSASSTGARTGKCMYTYGYAYTVAVPRLIDNLQELQLSLWARLENTSYLGDITIGVAPSVTAGELPEFDTITVFHVTSTSYSQFSAYLASSPITQGYIIIDVHGASSSYYTVFDDLEITEMPSCLPAIDLVANAGSNTVELSWNNIGEATTWIIDYDTAGFGMDDVHYTVTVEDTTGYLVEGLTPNKDYDFYVRGVCSATDSSEVVSLLGVHTACQALDVPYANNFNADPEGSLPECWLPIALSSSYPAAVKPASTGSSYHTFSSKYLYVNGPNTFATPVFNHPLNQMEVVFDLSFESYSSCGPLYIGYMLEGSNSVVYFDTIEAPAGYTAHSNFNVDILCDNLDVTGNARIVFSRAGTSNYLTAIDNFRVRHIATCKKVTDVACAESDATSATLTWSYPLENADNYTIIYGPVEGFNPDDPTTMLGEFTTTGSDTTYTIQGLDELTSYKVAIRANCDDETYGDWSAVAVFSTSVDCGEQSYRDVVYGTGTSTSGYFPAYYSYDYATSWTIYKASDLENMDVFPGQIKSISYQVNPGNSGDVSYPVKVYMAQDTRASFSSASDTSSLPAMQQVYSGVVRLIRGTWADIVLTTPFEYDPANGNLIIKVKRTGDTAHIEGSGYIYPYVLCTSASGASIYSYEGSYSSRGTSGYRPNMRFRMCVTEPDCFSMKSADFVIATPTTATIAFTEDARNAERELTTGHMVYAVRALESDNYLAFDPFNTAIYSGDYVSELCQGDSTLTISGLAPNTPYLFYVLAQCSDSYGLQYAMTQGRTSCAPWDLPFTTTFDGDEVGAGTFNVYCWQSNSTITTTPKFATNLGRSGNAMQFVVNGNAGAYQNSIAILPEVIDGYEMSQVQLSFWAKTSSANADGVLQIGVMSDPADTNTFELVDVINIDSTVFEEYKLNLTDYEGEGRFVAMKVNNNTAAGSYTITIDDVTLREKPLCEKPVELAFDATEISSNDIPLTWIDDENDSPIYQVVYKACANFNEANAMEFNSDTNAYLYDMVDVDDPDEREGFSFASHDVELLPGTIYALAVRAVCGNNYSMWSNPVVASTGCASISHAELPWTEDFNGVISYSTTVQNAPENFHGRADLDHVFYCFDFPGISNNRTTAPLAFAYQTGNANYALSMVATTTAPSIVVLPEFNDEVASLMLTFDYQVSNGTLELGVYDGEEFAAVEVIPTSGSMTTRDHLFSTDTMAFADGVRLAFRYTGAGTSTSASNVALIDNIVVASGATCAKPTNFVYNALAGVSAYSIPVKWTNGTVGDADTWEIEYKHQIVTPYGYETVTETATVSNVTPNDANVVSYTLNGLLPNTQYTLHVRGNCGEENGYSAWSNDSVVVTTKNDATYIASFSLYNANQQIGNAVIDSVNHTVNVNVVYGVDLTSVRARLSVSDGATAKIDGVNGFDWSNSNNYNYEGGLQVYVVSADPTIYQLWTIYLNIEPCATPTALTFENVKRREFTAVWTNPDANVTSFDLLYGNEPLTEAELEQNEPIVVTNANRYTFTREEGIVRDTMYYVYVRANCGESQSRWISGTVTTPNLGYFNCEEVVNDTLGTSTSNSSYFPGYVFYNYAYTQQLFQAEELLPTTINTISINCKTANDIRPVQMYLTKTDAASLSSGWVSMNSSNTVLAWEGQIGANTGWQDLELIAPYTFDGSSNLVITFVDNKGSYSSNYNYYYGNQTTSGVSRYEYSDNDHYTYNNQPSSSVGTSSNFRLQLAINHCGLDMACPQVKDLVVDYDNDDPTVVTLNWSSDGDYASEYQIIIDTTVLTDDELANMPESSILTAFDATSYTIQNLMPYTDYYLYIRVKCNGEGQDDGISTWNSIPFKTHAACRAPENISVAFTGKTTAVMSWSADATQDANYRYIISPTAVPNPDNYNVSASGLNVTSIGLSNLVPDQHYYFYLSNVCGGNDGNSPYVCYEFDMVPSCPAPINVRLTDKAPTGVTVAWESDTANFADENEWQVTCYAVDSTGAQMGDAQVFTVSNPSAVVTYLTPATNYRLEVRSICNGTPSITPAVLNFNTPVKVDCSQIGTGTSRSTSAPYNWGNYYTQILFRADEMHAMGLDAGMINAISLSYPAASAEKKVYAFMGTTTMTSFGSASDRIPQNQMTQVCGPLVRGANEGEGAFTYNFTTPFEWDGTSNLVVGILSNQPDGTSQSTSSSFTPQYTSTSYKSVVACYQDGTQLTVSDPFASASNTTTLTYRPNVTFCFLAGDCPAVSHVTAQNVASHTADVVWYTGGSETSWQVVRSEEPLTESALAEATPVTVETPSISYDDLVIDVTYYVYVRPICSEESKWVGTEFTTLPSCSAPSIKSLYANEDTVICVVAHDGEYGEAQEFEYEFWNAQVEDAEHISIVAGDSVAITSLPNIAIYNWRVRSICGEGDTSRWTNGDQFQLCGTMSLPFLDEFAQDSPSLGCWRVAGSSPTLGTSGTTAYLNFDAYGTYTMRSIITPVVPAALNTTMVTFKARRYSSSYEGQVKLYALSIEGNAITNLQELTTIELNSTDYENYEIYLDEFGEIAGDRIMFSVEKVGSSENWIYLDNFGMNYIPDCRRPGSFRLAAQQVNAHSVDLTWKQPGECVAWIITDTLTGQTYQIPYMAATVEGTNVNVNLGGLTANTNYVFSVRAVCDNSTSEPAVNFVNVRTLNDEATFTSYAVADYQVGTTSIDAVNHVIEVTVRADADIANLVSTFRVSNNATVLDAAGHVLVSGAGVLDFTYGQFVYLQPAGQDVAATEWEIRVLIEGCPTLYGLTANKVERTRLNLNFNTADSALYTFQLVYDTVALTAEELAVAEYQTITAEGEGYERVYHVSGLERETGYYFYLRNECSPAWLSVNAKTKALNYCDVIQTGNSSGTNSYMPLYSTYDYSYSQQIFDKEELTSGPITAFAIQNAAVKDRMVDIYLGTTTQSTFSGTDDFVPSSELTLVAHNVHMGTTIGWNSFTLAEPFMYDGTSNLVVAINNVNGSWSSGSSYNVTSCTGNKSVYVYRDGTQFTPDNAATSGASGDVLSVRNNIRFTICEENETCEPATEIAASDITSSSATLSWTASTSDYVGYYDVLVSDTAVVDFATIDSLDSYNFSGNALTCELNGLDPEVDYYVYVRARCNANGHEEGYSVWVPYMFRTFADCRSVVDLAADITSPTTATITWNFYEGVEGNFAYVISSEALEDGALAELTEDDYQEADLTVTEAYVEDLVPGETYYIYVTNVCGSSRSSWKEVSFTMPPACATPVSLTVSNVTSLAASLNWERGEFGEETEWQVIWVYGEPEDSSANAQIMTVNTNTAVIPFSVAGETYRAYVSAMCEEGNSAEASVSFNVPAAGTASGCVTIGDGEDEYNGAPTYTGWGNSYTQQIITVDEMAAQNYGAGSIESISYTWTEEAGYNKDLYIFIGSTSMDEFTSATVAGMVPHSNLTQVCGPISRSEGDEAGEMTFEFSTPWFWDGQSNIVIATITNQAAGESHSSSYGYSAAGTETDGYTTIYKYQDGTAFSLTNPQSQGNGPGRVEGHANIKFCFASSTGCNRVNRINVSGVTADAAHIDWYPSEAGNLDYNYVLSTEPLTIEGIAAAELMSVTALGLDLEDLTADADYYFYIAPTCAGTDDITLWNSATFATAPLCRQPILAVASVREEMGVVNFSITPDPETDPASYEYVLWANGMDTVVFEGSASENYNLEDLVAVTIINWKVRAICDEDGEFVSRWVAGNGFQYCGESALPYEEDFESYEGYTYNTDADAINCWKTYSTGSVRPHVISSGSYYYKHSGSKALTFYGSGYNYAAMPKMGAELNTMKMKFWRQTESASYGTLTVGYIKEGDNNFNTFTQIQQVSNHNSSMSEVTIDLSEVPEDADRIAFRWYYGNQYSCCIDDIRLYVPQQYNVTLASNDEELGTVEGEGEYAEDTYAYITAIPTVGNHFVQWSDENPSASRSLLMNQDYDLTAYFEADLYSVLVRSNDTVMGTATASFDEVGYGAMVDIEAIANEHAYFVAWSDGNEEAVRTIEVVENTVLTAIFAKDSFEVAAETEFEDIEIRGTGMYGYGDSAVLYAPNYYGYQFQNWSNGETEQAIGFRVYDNINITAYYVPDTFAIAAVVDPANAGTVTGAGSYPFNSEITLTAVPAAGFYFNGWSDGEINAERSYTVLYDDTLVANFATEARYTVNALANNDNMGTALGSGIYDANDTVTLTAVPAYGYHFLGWADGDTNLTRQIVATQNADYTANFEINTYNVSIAFASQGFAAMGSISIEGVEGLTTTVEHGTELVLNANATLGNHFESWSDGNTDTARVMIVESDVNLTATFAPNAYIIALHVTPAGAGIVEGADTLNYNSPYTISTTANHGYVFQMWSDSVTTMVRSGQLRENINLTAIYVKDTFHVTVQSADLAMGTVSEDADVAYLGTTTVRATANYGYQFVRWNDGVTTASRRVTVTDDTTLVAEFSAAQFAITVLSANNSMGTVTGSGNYAYLSNAEMTANPRAGFAFTMWEDSITDNPRTVQVEGPATYIAMFEPVDAQYTVTLNTNDATMGTVTGAGTYAVNSYANIEAIPNTNFRFVNWSDNNTEAARRLRVTSDTLLTAIFQPDTHTLNVVSNNVAQGTVTGAGQFVYGTEVTIEAIPAFGYHFNYWSGNSRENPYTFEFTSARNFYMAYFAPDTFTVAVNSTYGTVTGAGRYLYNRTTNIEAIDTNLEDNIVFARWSDGNTDNPRVLTITGDAEYTAIFEEANTTFTITAVANVAERGTVTGSGEFVLSAKDTLEATANEGYEFVQWNDGVVANPRVITVGGDATYTAQFDSVSYNVTLLADAKMGTVEGAGRYVSGRTATISATCTKAGYHFFNWSDGNTDNPRVLTVNEDITLTATFAVDTLTVTASVNDPALGTINGLNAGGRYTYGSYLTLAATANFGYEFVSWNDGNTNNIYQTIVTEDLNLVATFGPREYTINAAAEYAERGTVEGAGSYLYMSEAVLTAVANYGYHFVGWTDGVTDATRTVTVNGPNSYVALFDPNMYTVSVAIDTNMGTCTIEDAQTAYGKTAVLTVEPKFGYIFNGWSDGDVANPRTVTVLGDTVLTANFVADSFDITVLAGNDLGTVEGTGRFAYGEEVTISATPLDAQQNSFWYWNDGDTNAIRTIVVEGNATYTAMFGGHTYRVYVTAENGTVSQTNNGMILYGEYDTIHVTPNYGYVFAGWADGNMDSVRIVEVTGNMNLTALFTKMTFAVVVNAAENGTATGSGEYEYESFATLSATADAHYHFTNWSDGATDNPYNYQVLGDATLTANFAIDTHTVTATANNAEMGAVTVTGGVGNQFIYGLYATINAQAAYGYKFVEWSNGETVNPLQILVHSDTAVTAIFAVDQFDINVTCNAIEGTTTGTGSYDYGTTALIEATPNYGYHFVQWSDNNTENPRNVLVSSDRNFVAQFARNNYTLTLNVDSTYMGTVEGAGTFAFEDTVTITASANHGYHFTQWNDGDTNAVRRVVILSDTAFSAQYARNLYTITTSVNDPELGTVTGAGQYLFGQQVVLTAIPADASVTFTNWGDAVTENPRTITVNDDAEYRANFQRTLQTYTITLQVNDAVMGTVTGGGSYLEGTTAHIAAVANEHYEFDSWSDGNTNAVRDIVVTSNLTLTANFVAMNYMITVSCDATMGTVTGSGSYAYNTTATITATARQGYEFVQWSDGNTNATRTITVTGDAEYVAEFRAVQGIDDVDALDVNIYSTNGNIVVKGAANQSIYIYDAVGRCVNHVAENYSEVNEFTMPTSGVYMVKVGNLPARRVVVVR